MQFGISYISSVLKLNGHDVNLLVLSKVFGNRNKRNADDYIRSFKPDVICFTAVAGEYGFISRIADYIKTGYPNIYLVIGGAHVSLNPDGIFPASYNALCIGEGEYPVLELVKQLSAGKRPQRIRNMWFNDNGMIEKNKTRPFLDGIDSIPFPDRDMWKKWVETGADAAYPVLLGRGCPFQCTYCSNRSLSNLAKGAYVRLRSPENIVQEIKDIKLKYCAERFYLEVETIGANIRWALDLCKKLEELNSSLSNPVSFGTNLRITQGCDLEELFIAFKKSNFNFVRIGIESGSEKVRKHILGRNYSNQDIVNTVLLARRHGIKICFYNLLGVPGETFSDFLETVQINRRCQPDSVFAHIFTPYPGTVLHDICKRDGLLKRAVNVEIERCQSVLDLKDFPRKKIQKSFVWFDYYVYKGHRPMHEILAKVFVSKCRSSKLLYYFYRRVSYLFLFRQSKSMIRKIVGSKT
jgi:radical SAM superfamily enzyme YgiQ (UPF0313 family)